MSNLVVFCDKPTFMCGGEHFISKIPTGSSGFDSALLCTNRASLQLYRADRCVVQGKGDLFLLLREFLYGISARAQGQRWIFLPGGCLHLSFLLKELGVFKLAA